MKILSKLVLLFTIPAIAVSLSSCSSKTSQQNKLICISMPTKSEQRRWYRDGDNLKTLLEEKGYSVELLYAENSITTQQDQVKDMMSKNPDILIVAPVDSTALSTSLNINKSTRIISYDRMLSDTDNVDYYVTFDSRKVGEIQGKYIENSLELASGKGPFNIELFAGDENDINSHVVYDAALNVLNPYFLNGQLNALSGHTEYKDVTTEFWNKEAAYKRMSEVISNYYSLDKVIHAVMTPNDQTACGVIEALRDSGYLQSGKAMPVITGQDCDKTAVSYLKSGEQAMSLFKDTRLLASKVVEIVDAIENDYEETLYGYTMSYNNSTSVKTYIIEPELVTKENYISALIDSGYYSTADIN